MKNNIKQLLIIILLFLIGIFICIGIVFLVQFFNFTYAIPLFFSIISFFVASILLIRKKAFSIYFLVAVIIGTLFLINSAAEFELSKLPESAFSIKNHEFVIAVRPFTRGLPYIALGIAAITIGIVTLKKESANNFPLPSKNTYTKSSNLVLVLIGIFYILLGLLYFMDLL